MQSATNLFAVIFFGLLIAAAVLHIKGKTGVSRVILYVLFPPLLLWGFRKNRFGKIAIWAIIIILVPCCGLSLAGGGFRIVAFAWDAYVVHRLSPLDGAVWECFTQTGGTCNKQALAIVRGGPDPFEEAQPTADPNGLPESVKVVRTDAVDAQERACLTIWTSANGPEYSSAVTCVLPQTVLFISPNVGLENTGAGDYISIGGFEIEGTRDNACANQSCWVPVNFTDFR